MRLPRYSLKDMSTGEAALESGDVANAAEIFQGIIDAMEDTAPAEVYQRLGICLRMMGDRAKYAWVYGQADKAFRVACSRAKTDFHRGQIFRDWSMVAVGQRQYERAHHRLETSCDMLRLSPAEEFPTRTIEMHVTEGFIARVYYLSGDRSTAWRLLRAADVALYDTVPYELNNRAWSFKVAPLWYRLRWTPRSLRLAREARNWKRFGQIVGLVVCRPLAVRIAG